MNNVQAHGLEQPRAIAARRNSDDAKAASRPRLSSSSWIAAASSTRRSCGLSAHSSSRGTEISNTVPAAISNDQPVPLLPISQTSGASRRYFLRVPGTRWNASKRVKPITPTSDQNCAANSAALAGIVGHLASSAKSGLFFATRLAPVARIWAIHARPAR